jgi:hypothetical protein
MSNIAKFTDATSALKFIMGGKSQFTLVSLKTGTSFTYTVNLNDAKTHSFVSVLCGKYFTNQGYKYIGLISADLRFTQTKKSQLDTFDPRKVALEWVLEKLKAGKMPPSLEIWHEGSCGRCGRSLIVPSSIASGFGPECATRLSSFKAA